MPPTRQHFDTAPGENAPFGEIFTVAFPTPLGTNLAFGPFVRPPLVPDDVTILRLPRPPKPLNIAPLEAAAIPPIRQAVATGLNFPSKSPTQSSRGAFTVALNGFEPGSQRPALEELLIKAENLANTLTVSDPRGRLLQVALLRRDHTLIAAIVQACGVAFVPGLSTPTSPIPKRIRAKALAHKARRKRAL